MLIRIVVRLKVLGEQLVLMVQLIVRVVLLKCMGCLGKKCVLMIGDFWVVVGITGFFWKVVGGDCFDGG